MLLLTALALAGPADPLAVDARVATLPNGLRVVVAPFTRTDEVALHLHVGVGARDERDGERGLAHLFEHLMFEGSAHAPGNAYDAWLTAAGGDNNAFTSDDETAYHATFPSGALDLALFLESDRLGSLPAALSAESVANQIDVVLQERAQGYAAPHGRDFDALTRLVYPPEHPYHVPVIGTVADLQATTADGARAFFTRWYAPSGAVLGIVGNVDPDVAIARVEHWFSDVPSRPATPRLAPEPRPRRPAPIDGTVEDNVEDYTVHLAWPAPAFDDPDRHALQLAAGILSDGRGTRLDDLYFEKSWITGTSADAWAGEIDGMLVLSATTDRAGKARALERALTRAIRALADAPPSDDEVERARQRARAGLLATQERPDDLAESLVDCVRLYGDPNCAVGEWRALAAVQPAEISAVLRRVIDQPRARLWIAPKGRVDRLPVPPRPVELP